MLKGDRFGNLVFTGNKKNEDRRWLGEFECDCGNIRFIRMDGVKKGNNKSCGCKAPNKDYKKKRAEIGDDYPFHVLWKRTCHVAKIRKIVFAITIEQLKKQFLLQEGRCIYTNEPIALPKDFTDLWQNPLVASIDRIDSNSGYIDSNFQLVTKKVNMSKQSLSNQDFIDICKKVAKNYP